MNIISHLFQHLPGCWNFQRVISGAGTVRGTAVFKKAADASVLAYREEGVFTSLNNLVNNVYKNYIYRYQDKKISVFFEDDKPFHTLEFSGTDFPLRAQANHLCKCDSYTAVYTFYSEHRFSLHYSVKGPQKDYTIETIFTKQP